MARVYYNELLQCWAVEFSTGVNVCLPLSLHVFDEELYYYVGCVVQEWYGHRIDFKHISVEGR